jgi:hypothetical protein
MTTWINVEEQLNKITITNHKKYTEQKIINHCSKYFNSVKLIEHNTRLELKDGNFDINSWIKLLIICGKLNYSVIKITFNNKTYDLKTFNDDFGSDNILNNIKQYNILLIKI